MSRRIADGWRRRGSSPDGRSRGRRRIPVQGPVRRRVFMPGRRRCAILRTVALLATPGASPRLSCRSGPRTRRAPPSPTEGVEDTAGAGDAHPPRSNRRLPSRSAQRLRRSTACMAGECGRPAGLEHSVTDEHTPMTDPTIVAPAAPRRRRRATSPAGNPTAQVVDVETPAQPQAVVVSAPAVGEAPAAETSEAPTAGRGRSRRRATEPAPVTAVTQAEVSPEAVVEPVAAEEAAPAPKRTRTTTTRSRRATTKAAPEPEVVPEGEDEESSEEAARRGPVLTSSQSWARSIERERASEGRPRLATTAVLLPGAGPGEPYPPSPCPGPRRPARRARGRRRGDRRGRRGR